MNLNYKLIIFPVCIIFITSGCNSIQLKEDVLHHPILKTVFQEEKAFRKATGNAIEQKLEEVKKMYQKQEEWDPEKLQQAIKNKIKEDLILLAAFNEAIKFLPVVETLEDNTVMYALRYHQMIEAIQGASQELVDTNHFFELLEGNVPKGYAYHSDQITYLAPNDENIYGSSKGTFLKTALLYLYKALSEATNSNKKVYERKRLKWACSSPCYHITPLPASVNYNYLGNHNEKYWDSPWFLKGDDEIVHGYLFFAHSGYAFGGDTNNPRFINNPKIYVPEDCSSAICKWLKAPRYSTLDQLYAYRHFAPELTGAVPETWLTTKTARWFAKGHLMPLLSTNVPEDIAPGCVYVSRRFADDDPDKTMSTSAGISGHTTFVVGVENNRVLTIGYSRNMPEYEGFGLQEFPCLSDFPRKNMYWKVIDYTQ